jgi:lipopolysaccharide heptosyltransferase II
LETHQRILIIQTAFLGDVILTLPLVEAVHSLWPQAEIDFVVKASYVSFLDGHKLINHAIPYDKRKQIDGSDGVLGLAKRLRKNKYDLALIPHRSFRSGFISRLAGISKRVGFKGVAGSLWYTSKVPRDLDEYEGARNLALLDPFLSGESPDWDVRPRLDLADSVAHENVSEWMTAAKIPQGKRVIVLAPGSVWATKRWPEAHWSALLSNFVRDDSVVTILVGGPEDRDLCERVCGSSGNNAYNAAGELSVLGSAALIDRADLLITGDTAPLHLAQAVRTPTLAIFGPTVAEFGFAPTGENDRIVGLDLACRPCAIHGGRECPLGHHDCMKKLSSDQIWMTAREMLTEAL